MRNNIDDITRYIFIEDEPQKSDIIFIPGSSNWVLAETAASLYKEGRTNKIMPSGRYFYKIGRFLNERVTDERYKGNFRTEAEFLSSVLVKNGVADKNIIIEEKATNTYENAIFSKDLLKENNLTVKKAIICPQAFHARRAFMTYSHLFPDTEFYVVPTDTQGITADSWYKTERGIQVVLGELKKCGEYFEEYFLDEIRKQDC